MPRASVTPLEVFGLRPLVPGLKGCLAALRGDAYAPPTQWDRTSLGIFDLGLALRLWRGRTSPDRRAPIFNLPNRLAQTVGRSEGFDVRKTHCRDFRGGQLTYNDHVGTDFAIPPGTRVCTVAPGYVISVSNEMAFTPTRWDQTAVSEAIAGCRDPELQASLQHEPDAGRRAARVAIASFIMRHRFTVFPRLVREATPRRPRLDLPLTAADYVGVRWPDGRPPPGTSGAPSVATP